MTLKTLTGAVAALSLLAAAPAMAQTPDAPPAPAPAPAPASAAYTQIKASGNVAQTLRSAGQFTTYLKLMDMAGLGAQLSRAQPIAVFVPTDAAFSALPAGELAALMAPGASTQLQQRMAYLIFNDALDYDSKLKGTAGNIPGAGGAIYVDGAATPNTVNGATLLQHVKAANGDVYVIDKVIGPGYAPPAAPAAPAAAPAQ